MSHPQIRVPKRWGLRLAVVLVALAVLAGLATWISSLTGDDETSPMPGATPTGSGSPSPSETGAEARVANGCLGGQAVTAQTVLTAQDQAQLDDVGAAEFSATFYRWVGTGDSLPPADEVPTVLDAITAPDASESVTGLADVYEEAGPSEARQGEPGSTVDGGYYIESSTEDEVVVSILLVDREDASEGERAGNSVTFTLDRSSGEWLLVDQGGTRQPDDLYGIMTPFAGGC